METNTLYSQKYTMTGNAIGLPADVMAQDFKNIAIRLIGSNTANFSIRVKGSVQIDPPDFTAASTYSNSWYYIQLKDDINSTYYNGNAGYVFSANGSVILELNTSALSWVTVEVFSHTTGTLEAQFIFRNNE